MKKPTVAIMGASADRKKYGNKSVRAHLAQGYEVFPVNPKTDVIEGLRAYSRLAEIPVDKFDRISVYLPPDVGITLLGEIQSAGADEVWFNPGSESSELLARAEELGLNVVTACSIVNVGMRPDEMADE